MTLSKAPHTHTHTHSRAKRTKVLFLLPGLLPLAESFVKTFPVHFSSEFLLPPSSYKPSLCIAPRIDLNAKHRSILEWYAKRVSYTFISFQRSLFFQRSPVTQNIDLFPDRTNIESNSAAKEKDRSKWGERSVLALSNRASIASSGGPCEAFFSLLNRWVCNFSICDKQQEIALKSCACLVVSIRVKGEGGGI